MNDVPPVRVSKSGSIRGRMSQISCVCVCVCRTEETHKENQVYLRFFFFRVLSDMQGFT